MFNYYFRLGLRSLRRNPVLTALMVLTLAVGVAASVSTLTVLHMMSADPLPDKSERVFTTVIDIGPVEGYTPANPGWINPMMTYRDGVALQAGLPGERRTLVYNVSAPVEPRNRDLPVLTLDGIAAHRDFFAMMEAPFEYGQAWSEADDKAGADAIVLSHDMAATLFGAVDPTGKRLHILGVDMRITGVLKPWHMIPKFYRIWGGNGGAFGHDEDFVMPFRAAIARELGTSGNMVCMSPREPGFQGTLKSECTWLELWVETRTAGERADVQSWLDHYTAEQRKLGRIKRAAPNPLYNVTEWLAFRKLVSDDSRVAAWLAFGFLLLCLINTIGLLLAKFTARGAEIGVRRALGAARRDIFAQSLIEAAVVGLAGGVAGLGLSFGALALIGMQDEQSRNTATMDWQMLLLTFAMSLVAAVLAGLLPTWRACRVAPAVELKSQ